MSACITGFECGKSKHSRKQKKGTRNAIIVQGKGGRAQGGGRKGRPGGTPSPEIKEFRIYTERVKHSRDSGSCAGGGRGREVKGVRRFASA